MRIAQNFLILPLVLLCAAAQAQYGSQIVTGTMQVMQEHVRIEQTYENPPPGPHIIITRIQGEPLVYHVRLSDGPQHAGQPLSLYVQVHCPDGSMPLNGGAVMGDRAGTLTLTLPAGSLPAGQQCVLRVFAEGYYGHQLVVEAGG